MSTFRVMYLNKDENVRRFALSAIGGELLERERKRERERETIKKISLVVLDKNSTKKVWPKVNTLISRDLLNANLKMILILSLFYIDEEKKVKGQ